MFVFFGGVHVRSDHITFVSPIIDHGEGAGSQRYQIRISLINGVELVDTNANVDNSNATYNRLRQAVNF